jgi:hypothetical protein
MGIHDCAVRPAGNTALIMNSREAATPPYGSSTVVKPENKINNTKAWANCRGVLSRAILELMQAWRRIASWKAWKTQA